MVVFRQALLPIFSSRKVAFVDFNVHIEKTPFGEVMLPDFLKKSPVLFRAEFVLFDD